MLGQMRAEKKDPALGLHGLQPVPDSLPMRFDPEFHNLGPTRLGPVVLDDSNRGTHPTGI